jgi:hypothetical protein
MKSLPFIILIALATVVGCDRGVEPFDAGKNPQTTRPANSFPTPVPATEIHAADSTSQTLEGTIQVAPALAGQIPDSAVLFLIARTAATGPPLAVKRLPTPQFPFDFSIGPDDRMIQAMPFQGPIRLSARIDADGNATTRSPGDLQTNSDTAYDPGARSITLLINEAL